MFDQEYIEEFVRSKVLLQEKLSETGDVPGSSEIESQMMFIETRMIARIKQDIYHGREEMNALRYILIVIEKTQEKEG